jgi:hypothetical protein
MGVDSCEIELELERIWGSLAELKWFCQPEIRGYMDGISYGGDARLYTKTIDELFEQVERNCELGWSVSGEGKVGLVQNQNNRKLQI